MAISDVPCILDLIHMTPEIQQRARELREQGLDATKVLLQVARERGRIISESTQIDNYFCEPIGNEGILERAVAGTGMTVAELNARRGERLAELQQAGRVVRPEDYHQVVSAIYNALPNQIVILPTYVDQMFIPNTGRNNWLRRGNVIIIPKSVNIEDKIQEALRDAWNDDFELIRSYRGIRFQGQQTNNGVHRFFSFYSIIRGELLCAATKHLTITLKPYDGSKPLIQGRKVHVEKIPRFSEQVSHAANKVTIGSLPIYEDRIANPISAGYDVQWESNNTGNTITVIRFEPGKGKFVEEIEDQATHHVVLAYLRTKKYIEPELPEEFEHAEGNGLKLRVPFPRPDAKTLRFWWQTLQKVRIEKYDDRKGRTYLAQPTKEQVCYLLSKFIGERAQSGEERAF